MSLKCGTLCYACDSGLGILARSFARAGVITHPFVVRHPSHQTHDDWYPGAPQTPIRPLDLPAIHGWLKTLDVFLVIETPFDWSLFPFCREAGVKTALLPMYECFPRQFFGDPRYVPYLYLCPSLLDLDVFARGDHRAGQVVPGYYWTGRYGGLATYLPVPVDVPWRQRTEARVFVHNAGHGSFRDRNGTRLLAEALQHIRSPAKFIIRSQHGGAWSQRLLRVNEEMLGHVDNRTGTFPYETLWDEGDVFVFVERFNGLSLPLQEARAAGMLVVAGDRWPMNTWLPREPLVPASSYTEACISPAYLQFIEAQYDPRAVAAKVDEVYGMDVSAYSAAGKAWAATMTWDVWRPKYLDVLEGLCS